MLRILGASLLVFGCGSGDTEEPDVGGGAGSEPGGKTVDTLEGSDHGGGGHVIRTRVGQVSFDGATHRAAHGAGDSDFHGEWHDELLVAQRLVVHEHVRNALLCLFLTAQ